jgi:hypothetical protein
MFMLSFFEVLRGVLEKIDYYRSRFYWQSDQHKKKYMLARWNIICQPKDQGGFRIQNIGIQNRCLLSKWLFKLINEEGVWKTLLRQKYLKSQTITHVQKKPRDSHFWSGLMKVKDSFFSLGRFNLNNGMHIQFWEDKWLGNFTLQHHFPSLYEIVRRKHASVASVFSSIPLNISFRIGLVGNNLRHWHNLVAMVAHNRLNRAVDVFVWGLYQNGQFSVKSMYNALIVEV